MSEIEAKLEELGYALPAAPEAVGFYTPVLKTGSLVMTSGQLPFVGPELQFVGKIGLELSLADGINAARTCALNALSQIKQCVGSLDLVEQIVRVEGYVNSAPGTTNQPNVVNGASELFIQVFGERGRHTRIALAVPDMPLNAAVQVAVWAEVKDS